MIVNTKFDVKDDVYAVNSSSLTIAKVVEIIINETFDTRTIRYKLDVGAKNHITRNECDVYGSAQEIVEALEKLKPVKDK